MAFTISPVVQLLLCSITLYTLYFLYQRTTTILNRRKFVQKHACKAPAKYPHKDPVFGLDMLWGTIRAVKSKSYMARIRHLHQQNGNTYSSHYLLSPIIHTIEPDNLKAVLSTNFKDYGISPARKEAFLPLFGQSILVSDGALWEHSRGLLRPSFARSQVGDLAMFDGHVTNLLKSIPRDGSVVDLGDLFFGLTADVITDFMFGESIGSLTQPDSFRNHIMQAFHDVEFGAEERWRRGKFANYLPHSEFYKSVRQVHSFIDEHVAKAIEHRNSQSAKQESAAEEEEKTKERYILLRELGKVTDDRKQLRSELLTVFLAGRDTTASLLCNVFFVFARRPDIWRRLRIEVAELKGEKPTFAQLGRMDYLRSCLNECKCLHPNLPAPKKSRLIGVANYIYKHSQHSASTHPSPTTPASPSKTPSSPSAAALKPSPPSSSPRTQPSISTLRRCTGGKISGARTLRSFDRRDGRTGRRGVGYVTILQNLPTELIPLGDGRNTFPLVAGPGRVLVVRSYFCLLHSCAFSLW